jgi:RNA ligase
MFPYIHNINQAREAIVGRPEFSETDKGDYIVFNYHVAHDDSFDCPVRRELRGLIFSPEGHVLSRPFHKFFNLNEKEETRNVDWSVPHMVFDKLDGSMVRPIPLPSGIRWGTKMGVTDVSIKCEAFVARHPNYNSFAFACVGERCTPIFEYISPDNRIVLPYQSEDCVLLAIRRNDIGEYLNPSTLEYAAKKYSLSLVKEVRDPLDAIPKMKDVEGVVVRFISGHMIKIKSEWYVAIHKAKENLLFEKNVIKMILEEKIDDILPNLPDSDVERIREFQETLLTNIDHHVSYCQNILNEAKSNDKKHFAMNVAPNLHPWFRVVCFAGWNNHEKIRDIMITNILKKCGSQTDVDSIREIIGGKW